MTVEMMKEGGPDLRKLIFEECRRMWRSASRASEGGEGEEWPKEWKEGLVIPLWKKKGRRSDKNTWRGITLLSVGSKIMARVVAARIMAWTEGWLDDRQCGFRRGRGVEDALQVTRRVVEQVSRGRPEDEVVYLCFFDIEKAYPRVCRAGLWELLRIRGCDERMISVCRALHEWTEMKVRVEGGESRGYYPERGLREGCPSSPPLFNVYHDAVMEDFRRRRRTLAEEGGQVPGLEWFYKVDGKLKKRTQLRVRTRGGR